MRDDCASRPVVSSFGDAATSRRPEDTMADSTLAREATIPTSLKGHDTAALGPSDSSDTGSDIAGGPGLNLDDGLTPSPGTTSDPDIDAPGATAGADIGDADLDSDSDREGTGERGAAGRDATLPNDTILRVDGGAPIDAEQLVDAGADDDEDDDAA
jgi:hypothetical protein